MTRIDPAALAERLAGNPLARRIVVLEETPSTNLAAKALAAQDAPSGTLVLANRQTAGRGRRGRAWRLPRAPRVRCGCGNQVAE